MKRWHTKEATESFDIDLEVGWKLEEQQPKLVHPLHRLERRDELGHIVLAVA
jgi:hypothetical protein